MNRNITEQIVSGIRTEYVEEAIRSMDRENGNQEKKKNRIRRLRTMAACIALVCVVGAGVMLLHARQGENAVRQPLSVSAAELGEAEMPFGATMPSIIYAKGNLVIMYDYIGIWTYDLQAQKLTGFCDFRPIDMTQIQGDPCVFVEATKDGRYVKFYMNDDSVKYLYDVEKNEYKKVDAYHEKMAELSRLTDVTDEHRLTDYAETYVMDDGRYISYDLDFSGSGEVLKYRALQLVVEQDGETMRYPVFQ